MVWGWGGGGAWGTGGGGGQPGEGDATGGGRRDAGRGGRRGAGTTRAGESARNAAAAGREGRARTGGDARRGERTSSSTAKPASRPDSGFGASSSDIATDSRVEARVRECAPGGERGEREEGPSVGSSAARTKTSPIAGFDPVTWAVAFSIHRRRLLPTATWRPPGSAHPHASASSLGGIAAPLGAARAHDAGPPSASPPRRHVRRRAGLARRASRAASPRAVQRFG